MGLRVVDMLYYSPQAWLSPDGSVRLCVDVRVEWDMDAFGWECVGRGYVIVGCVGDATHAGNAQRKKQ